MPFDLKNRPALFSRFINTVFQDMINNDEITIYIDDILIATETADKNIRILAKLFKVLRANLLTLRFDKCNFLNTVIDFLGYVTSHNMICPHPRNVKAVSEFG